MKKKLNSKEIQFWIFFMKLIKNLDNTKTIQLLAIYQKKKKFNFIIAFKEIK